MSVSYPERLTQAKSVWGAYRIFLGLVLPESGALFLPSPKTRDGFCPFLCRVHSGLDAVSRGRRNPATSIAPPRPEKTTRIVRSGETRPKPRPRQGKVPLKCTLGIR